MKKHCTVLRTVVASILVLSPLFAHADTLSDIKSRGVLTVGVKNDYPPYGFMDAQGKTDGFEVQLARSIAAQLLGSPDKIKLVPVNASNRIQFLQAGQIDLIMATLGVTPERAKEIDFTVPYVSAAGASVIARKEAKFTQWEQLAGQNVCGIQGSYYNKLLTEKYKINLVNFTALPEAYRALQDNRCVAMAFDDMTLRNKLEQPDWKGYKVAIQPYEFLPMAGGVRKGDDTFLKAVNAAIVKTEGENKLIGWEKQFDMPASDYIAKRAEAARAAAK